MHLGQVGWGGEVGRCTWDRAETGLVLDNPVPGAIGEQQEEQGFLVLCSERVPSSPVTLRDSGTFSKARQCTELCRRLFLAMPYP